MTAEYVAFHATERPHAVAIIDNGREITYSEFSRDIRKFTRALREFELPRGAKVAIGCEDTYSHWLIRIAFENLCVVTEPFLVPESPSSSSHLRDLDLVLSEKTFRTEQIGRQHAITPEWLRGILARADEGELPSPAKGPDDPLHILPTSGTTGTRKRLLHSRRIHERRIAKLMWFNGLTHDSRYLLAVSSTARTHAACIWSGATVVIEDRMTLGQAIAAHAITHATLPPIVLKHVLDEISAGFVKPDRLTIFSFGAAASRGLCERALTRLATGVYDLYGSNEVGFISSKKDGAEVGSVWPGVQVAVVNDRDEPLPFGEAGWIRVKTDCMVQGYLNDPDATGRTFRNGWFYTADLGILHDAHRLQVIGRGDDVLNIGGQKIAPDLLEDMVLNATSVGDVAICPIHNADGIEEICIAVSDARGNDQELLECVNRAFRGYQIGRFYMVRTDRIPRNANGKIQRKLLKDVVATAMRAR